MQIYDSLNQLIQRIDPQLNLVVELKPIFLLTKYNIYPMKNYLSEIENTQQFLKLHMEM